MIDLGGRTALVTGASHGIGTAIAKRLAADGARVAVHYNSNELAAKKIATDILDAGGCAFTVHADFGLEESVEDLLAAVRNGLGGARLDILVNNAGAFGGTLDHVTPDEFDHLFAVNVRAPFFLIKHALPQLADGARIVNISSGATRVAVPHIVYAMTKGAIDVMTRTMAWRLGMRGITLNAIAPGITENTTNMCANGASDPMDAIGMTALGRIGQPRDVADVVGFLTSDDARWITGQVIDVCGGLFLGP